MGTLRDFQDAVIVRNIVASIFETPESKKAVYDFIEKSGLGHDLVMGMSAAAKKKGQKFGMRDAKAAIAAFVEGDEPKQPALLAAWDHLKSSKGKQQLQTLIDGVVVILKKEQVHVGFRDVGQAVVAWFGE